MIKKILFILALLIIGVGFFLYTTDNPLTGKITEQIELEKTINFMEENNLTLYVKSGCVPCEKQTAEFGNKLDKAIDKGVIFDCTEVYKSKCYGLMPKWTYNEKQIAAGYIATENIEAVFTKLIEQQKLKETNSTA